MLSFFVSLFYSHSSLISLLLSICLSVCLPPPLSSLYVCRLKSGMSGGMSGGGMSMSGMAGMAGMMGGEEVAELMIPANKVGLIIGTHTHHSNWSWCYMCILCLRLFACRKRGRNDQSSSGIYTHCYKTEQQCHFASFTVLHNTITI